MAPLLINLNGINVRRKTGQTNARPLLYAFYYVVASTTIHVGDTLASQSLSVVLNILNITL